MARFGGHCTADQITEELRRTKPTFPRSTVYRGLEALTAAGSLYAAHLGEGATHYELASGDHHHAVCKICGGGLHIEEDLVTRLQKDLQGAHRFKPPPAEGLVVRVCEACPLEPGHHGPRPPPPGALH